MVKKLIAAALVFALAGAAGCMRTANNTSPSVTQKPEMPEGVELADGTPMVNVYVVKDKATEEMDLETYLLGVVAGEMKNDWPIEALKAQAILARTFVMDFISEKDSKYEGADISTDVSEAQAYDASAVNDRIREAVSATRGEVLAYDGKFAKAWFHAHAGGATEVPSAALEYRQNDPEYVKSVKSDESKDAPEDVKSWTAEFTLDQIERACKDSGVTVGDVTSIEIGDKGESGRAINFIVNGKEVSAPRLRLNLGANKLRSTLLTGVSLNGESAVFTGRGFGHGVGMSQWGAYEMANAGKSAEEIIEHYFEGTYITELY